MKSYKVTSVDPANPEKFLAYMVPSPNEVDMLVLRTLALTVHSCSRGSYIIYHLNGGSYQKIPTMNLKMFHILGFASIITMYVPCPHFIRS